MQCASRTGKSALGCVPTGEVCDTFSVYYHIRLYHVQSAHDALWELTRDQFKALKPQPVILNQSLDEIAHARLGGLCKYFVEDPSGSAGFVTNCHPQDGKQLSNVVQNGSPSLPFLRTPLTQFRRVWAWIQKLHPTGVIRVKPKNYHGVEKPALELNIKELLIEHAGTEENNGPFQLLLYFCFQSAA